MKKTMSLYALNVVYKKILIMPLIFRKTAEKRSKRFKIKKNRRGSRRRHRVRYASVSGTCCWKMCDANGECDEFLLAHDRVPRVAYVYRLQARTCQN